MLLPLKLRQMVCAACLALPASLAADEAPQVEVMRLVADPSLNRAETYFGTVRATEMTGLSYNARGCVIEVSEAAKRSRQAKAGQVLVRLDDQRTQLALRTAAARVSELGAVVDERELAITAARADYQRRKQELDLVTEEFQRNSVMFGRGLINESAMDAAERGLLDATFAFDRADEAITTAIAAKNRADIALEIGELDRQSAEISQDQMTLRAPFDGVLVGFDVSAGECVQEGESAGQIYVPAEKSIEIYFLISRLSADEADRVSVGRDVSFTRVNGAVCGGTISRLDSAADLETQYVEATVDVDPSCAPDLFLNEAVEVSTTRDAAQMYLVPKTAMTEDNAVFLVDEDSLKLVSVTPQIVSDQGAASLARIKDAEGRLMVVEVPSGYRAGQVVALSKDP